MRDVEGMSKCWEKDVFPMIVIQKVVGNLSSDFTILRSNGHRLRFSWKSCQFSHLSREVNWKLTTIGELLFMPLTWSWSWLELWVWIHWQTQSLVGHKQANISQVSEIFCVMRKTKVPTLFFREWSHLRSFASGSRGVPSNVWVLKSPWAWGKFGQTEDTWSSSNPPFCEGSKVSSVFLVFKSCQRPGLLYFFSTVSNLLNLEQGCQYQMTNESVIRNDQQTYEQQFSFSCFLSLHLPLHIFSPPCPGPHSILHLSLLYPFS